MGGLMIVANGVVYFPKNLELEGGEIGDRVADLAGQCMVGRVVLGCELSYFPDYSII